MPRRFFTPARLVHRPRRLLAGLLLLIALLLASVPGAALAAPGQGRPVDPHTPVASDGEAATTAPDASIVRGKGEAYSPSAEGTGALVERGRRVTADPDVEGHPHEGASPESVIAADGRYQITGPTTYPYRAIAHITTSRGGCTGCLIGVDTVATAGHCVHSGGSGGTWAT